jgi:D-alanyl-D-alanine carboxypeptidase/D-alanyl-D-alanine-endopeptidase (penicillin-binding protein 4)
VRFESIKKLPKTLINHTSEPLSHIIKAINSWSNNLSAEVVVLSMAQKRKLRTTFANGLGIVMSFASSHLKWSDFTMTNGSGLFGSTRVSPDQMTRLLSYMYTHRDQYPDYLASLAAAGLDGTMKKRLVDLKGAEVYAKTGTLDGVSGLSGYIRLKRGDMVAFSILQNDFKTSARPVRALQDDIVRAFVKTESQVDDH